MPVLTPPEIVSHRGSGQDADPPVELSGNRPATPPENTLPAFVWGWERGTTCELDVHLSRDERLIVIHDPTTGRTCDRDLTVADATLAELRGLDAGSKKGPQWSGLRPPTLEEVFDAMPADRRLYIELKTGPGIVEPLVAAVRSSGKGPQQLVFISFNVDSIGRIKQSLPEFTGYLIVSFNQSPEGGSWTAATKALDPADKRRLNNRRQTIRSDRPGAVSDLYRELLDLVQRPLAGDSEVLLDGLDVTWNQPDSFADAMRAAGIDWGCWTVDTGDAALLMARRGALQITSNCPGDIRDVLRQAESPA